MPIESDAQLREILGLDTIAVVGCSSTPGKDAHEIPAYMQRQGYEVIPVNPYAERILERRAYDSLTQVEETVDIVNVFRPSEEVANIVEEVLDRDDVDVVWTQLGIRDPEALTRVEDSGRMAVQDRCLKVEHRRLVG